MPWTFRRPLSRGRRPLLIFVVLLACLALIGSLGWQAWQIQRSNEAVANAVLRDYATLAAEEFGRRFSKSLGYFGYLALIRRCSTLGTANSIRVAIQYDDSMELAAGLAKTYFTYDGEEFSVSGTEIPDDLEARVRELARGSRDPSQVFEVDTIPSTGEQIVFRRWQRGKDSWPQIAGKTAPAGNTLQNTLRAKIRDAGASGQQELCGFIVDDSNFADFVEQTIDWDPLLPPSLAGGMVANEMLFIEVLDPQGDSLFRINPALESNTAVTSRFLGDPEGKLDGYTVRVGIDSYSAASLIIGGLPKSRLPLLIAVLVTTILLLITAIWLFRREESVLRMREEFVSQVSHELRTPLTQIRMFAETLLLKRERNDAERERSLAIIDRESKRLSHLVENVLRVSKVADAISLDCTKQPIAPILQDICAMTRSTHTGVRIECVVDDGVTANVKEDALRQILLNLIDNAIKYGPAGQTIRISLRQDAGESIISIEDEGPGIPNAERERVWSAFYRLRREQVNAIGGTGIGLAVTRQLTEAMGGRCWFDRTDKGARVNVALPTE